MLNPMMRLGAAFVALLLLLAGCAPRAQSPSGDVTIDVVCTVGMIEDAVKEIGGSRVKVQSLMGPGVDPHLYKATASDVSKLERARLILFVGLELEGRMADVLEKIGKQKPSRAVGDAIPKELLTQPAAFAGRYDPHVWFDVKLWQRAIVAVRDALIEVDPGSKALFESNAKRYVAELESLDAEVVAAISGLPQSSRVLITAHDAFGYFGKRYGLEVHGIQGMSTASEAGPADIRRLADLIVKKEVKAIFVETSVPNATIEALQKAAASRGWEVKIGEQLFSDAMGQPGTPEGTYIGMVRHNVRAIVEGLR